MKKDILILFSLVLLVSVLIMGTDIQSVDEYYMLHIDDITPQSQTVSLSIRCDTVLENWEKLTPSLRNSGLLPPDGVILPQTEYVLRPGDTVFDLLERVTRHEKIQMEFQGADLNRCGSVYVQGIHYLYEFSCGPLSGWVFLVNGEAPNRGSSKYELQDGDAAAWVYTCDLGRNSGVNLASFQGKAVTE